MGLFLQNSPKFVLNIGENVCTWVQRLNLHFWVGLARPRCSQSPSNHWVMQSPGSCCNSPNEQRLEQGRGTISGIHQAVPAFGGSGCSRERIFPSAALPSLALHIILSGKRLSVLSFCLCFYCGLVWICEGISLWRNFSEGKGEFLSLHKQRESQVCWLTCKLRCWSVDVYVGNMVNAFSVTKVSSVFKKWSFVSGSQSIEKLEMESREFSVEMTESYKRMLHKCESLKHWE